MDNDRIIAGVIGKTMPRGGFHRQLFAGVFFQQRRYFDGADVAALSVMCAALADQDLVAVFQAVDGRRAACGSFQHAIVAGHEYRK